MTANAINHVYMTKIDKSGTFTNALSRNLSQSHKSVSPLRLEVTRSSDVYIGSWEDLNQTRLEEYFPGVIKEE